ncbi:MAG: cytochrome c [Flavobacteriales bacterium]|nr:cytochrome c [Flavobacteriales bacterium]
MNNLFKIIMAIAMIGLISCGNDAQKEAKERREKKMAEKKAEKALDVPASKMIDFENKGIGPVSSLSLAETIDEEMVTRGHKLFKAKCSACHKISKKFVGPSPKGVLERRSPEWVMNMILNPDEMVSKDPLAKKLLFEFNGSPMANQNLTEEEARDILEYFRTLK